MCGIFFYYNKNQKMINIKKDINSAVHYLKERGPDNSCIDFFNNFVIGHTRLSIIDLSHRANQPFWDEEKRFLKLIKSNIYSDKTYPSFTGTAGTLYGTFERILGGPPKGINYYNDRRYVTTSACEAHACPEKAFIFIDTKDKSQASKIEGLDIRVLDTKIKMQNKMAEEALAGFILKQLKM